MEHFVEVIEGWIAKGDYPLLVAITIEAPSGPRLQINVGASRPGSLWLSRSDMISSPELSLNLVNGGTEGYVEIDFRSPDERLAVYQRVQEIFALHGTSSPVHVIPGAFGVDDVIVATLDGPLREERVNNAYAAADLLMASEAKRYVHAFATRHCNDYVKACVDNPVVASDAHEAIVRADFALFYEWVGRFTGISSLTALLARRGFEADESAVAVAVARAFQISLQDEVECLKPELGDDVRAYVEFFGENYPVYAMSVYHVFGRDRFPTFDDFSRFLQHASVEDQIDEYERDLFAERPESNDISQLNGEAFERYVATALERSGYRVEVTQRSHDFGGDLIATRSGRKLVIQVKRYDMPVGIAAVQEVVAAQKFYGADGCVVVTNADFTVSAIRLARANAVRLISGPELATWDRGVRL